MDKNEIRAQDFTAQVRREIYIMRNLQHKNIVRLEEVLTSDTKLYIVMELITGGELFRRIENGRVPEALARQYFQQLVDGVDFCHKNGVAHRDLKPENLLLGDNGDLKITDFGFSSMKGRDVNAGLLYTQCGTPDYCAPEIIESAKDGYNGAKVDAWSCGVILFALLCGRLPFQEQDTDRLYDLILACKVNYPAEISTEARDLLENLLVRDPSKRYDLQKVKRHPWFLVNYDGDDAKLIKKRPFFNKNQKDLSNSNPSSPVTSQPDSNGSLRTATPTAPIMNGDAMPSVSPMTGVAGFPGSAQSPALVPVTYGEGVDTGSYGSLRAAASEPPQEASHLQQAQLHMQQGYGTEPGMRNSPLAGRPMPPVPRVREDQYALYRPSSPAGDVETHGRAPTPPAHAVFTRVEDRPATPARRQTSAAFKAAKVAAAMNSSPVNGHAVPPVSPGFSHSQGQGQSRLSPSGSGSQSTYPSTSDVKPSRTSFEAAAARFSGPMEITAPQQETNDDSSSEQDSTEDYEDKPALQLEIPIESLSRMQSAKGARRTQRPHSLQHTQQQRHRSDLGVTATSGQLGGLHAVDNGPASMSSIQMQRRGFTRDPIGNDPRSLRLGRNSEVPSSPPVVYSPSGTNGAPYDRYRSVSPGFGPSRQGIVSEGSSPNSVPYSTGISGFPTSWNQPLSSRDEVVITSGSSFQAPIFSRHLWNMICKLRGTAAPANEKVSQDLRADLKLMYQELNQLSRPEDVASIFRHFLHLLETLGLSDGPGSSPGGTRAQHRSRGTSDMDEEYEDGTTTESREDTSGETRFGMTRRTGTDMSSEEEPLSWSPVLAESTRLQSDLARRRNISDLLNKWLKKTNATPGIGPDRGDRTGFAGNEEEPSSATDLMELQRLMREHHGGREDSNIADEFLRLMDSEDIEDGNSTPFGTVQPGQSPPAPATQPSRPPEPYVASRFPGSMANNHATNRPNTPLRSVTGSNVPLPPEYVPGRFQEPNSMPARTIGTHRQNGLAGRRGTSEMGEVGDTLGRNRSRENMASSMGMHDVAYYESDKKNGMTMKLRGVLQTMKTRNQKLGEKHAQFKTPLAPKIIMQTLGRILQDMGGEVLIKKETKRKMKCIIPLHSNQTLHAGIELIAIDEGLTCVAFRRSKADKGRTDTDSFHTFYERVRKQFVDEANRLYPNPSKARERQARRRNGHGFSNPHMSESAGHLSLS